MRVSSPCLQDCARCPRPALLHGAGRCRQDPAASLHAALARLTLQAPPACTACRVCAAADVDSSSSASEASTSGAATAADSNGAAPALELHSRTDGSNVPTAPVWELDFCSRPLLDERGKKVWELLICDQAGDWVFSRYFPNNKINSTELKAALKEVLAQPGVRKPERVLFFRSQMQTIITRALQDIEIVARPSRRCFTLIDLLNDRLERVYKRDERYSEGASTMFTLDLAPPEDVADALRGEQWAFVQLPLSHLKAEMAPLDANEMFGKGMPTLPKLGLSDSTLVPGVAVFSRRARPLAAWTNGLEIACVKADIDRACLLLEAGVRDRYRYGAWRRSPEAEEEARAWEAAKKQTKGLHFLAHQTHAEAEECTGIWLLMDAPMPDV